MVQAHNLGFPRIGPLRELKFALEAYWRGALELDALEATGARLRHAAWQRQRDLDLVPVGDFSLYDHVLDTSMLLGNVPARVRDHGGNMVDRTFRWARGRAREDGCSAGVDAGEMTKWFDTNYHYIVPEFTADTRFELHADHLLATVREAQQQGVAAKPVLVGPVTYLWLGKAHDRADKLALLPRLLPAYRQLLTALADAGVAWVQLDEPILAADLAPAWAQALVRSCAELADAGPNLLLTVYFGDLGDNLELACGLPVHGLHIDARRGHHEVDRIAATLRPDAVLSLGTVDGRNVWRTDLRAALDVLEPQARTRKHLWIAPTCSLLHVPIDLVLETHLDPEVRGWLAFAAQKLDELVLLRTALVEGRDAVATALAENAEAVAARRRSSRVHDPAIAAAVAALTPSDGDRKHPYPERARRQAAVLPLPTLPTTTIGSFPQTAEIRRMRRRHRSGEVDRASYERAMKEEIAHGVERQEALGLDVLVHGEPERNDMVEYFGEQLEGFVFSTCGWVQSYGSRCVKPPILFGDVRRPKPMTVAWFEHAQSCTEKPMKGMLTGPVTMLNWSFVRDDQPRATTCRQLALAIRQEVLDLEAAGARIIQIDEAALREGLPLRRSRWAEYLDWAIASFRIAANGVADETQIHTHMCYSEFGDILDAIARMDADVITIETSRSNMDLLDAFRSFAYPNAIGPGVYDIHSPNVPPVDEIVHRVRLAAERIPIDRLWINPDCGLKTRGWPEVTQALAHMVAAARRLRESLGSGASALP